MNILGNGIDIVKNSNPLLPDNKLAKYIINYCKNYGILLSTDGPYNNVLKIKPPLIFSKKNADFLIKILNKSFLRYEKK